MTGLASNSRVESVPCVGRPLPAGGVSNLLPYNYLNGLLSVTELNLRTGRSEDAAELTALALASKGYWGYHESLIELWHSDLEFSPSFIEDYVVVVAEHLDRLVGVVAITRDGEMRELEHLWVHPAFMGRGVGRRLFLTAVAEAAAGGASTLAITADPHAEPFYLRMGAVRVDTVPSTPEGRRLPRLLLDTSKPATTPDVAGMR